MAENNANEIASATPVNETSYQSQTKKSFCKYCGNELQLGATFCSSCGKPQGNVPVQQMASPVMQPQQSYGQSVQQPAYMVSANQQPQPAMGSNTTSSNTQSNQTTFYVQGSRSNGFGTAGFIFALLSFFVCWVPVVDIIVWFFGALFSFIGLFKAPRGLAITGFILSFIGIIILITVFGALIGFAAK